MYPGLARTARDEGYDEIADWFETLARAEKSHAGRRGSTASVSGRRTNRTAADEILDLGDYERRRRDIRASAMRARRKRRVLLGPHAAVTFENCETVHYQIQEMLRAERIARPDDDDALSAPPTPPALRALTPVHPPRTMRRSHGNALCGGGVPESPHAGS